VQVVEQLRLSNKGKVTREEFACSVLRAMGHPVDKKAAVLCEDDLDIIYQVLDTDKDGFLELD
jgi:hypothetical protein